MTQDRIELSRVTRRLIAAARRRWIAVRAAEAAALGAGAGAVVAAAITAGLWWAGQPSMLPAAVAIGFCSLVATSYSFMRAPGTLATARRLDEQHRLHDLLSSAVSIDRMRDDQDIAAVVVASANAAAARIADDAAPLPVTRFGGGTYSAVAMGLMLSLTLAAVASPERSVSPGDRAPAGLELDARRQASIEHHGQPLAARQSNQQDQTGPTRADRASEPERQATDSSHAARDLPRGEKNPAAGRAAAGSGDDRQAEPAPAISSLDLSPADGGDRSALAAGRRDTHGGGGPPPAAGSAASEPLGSPVTPDRPISDADRDVARRAVENRQVPSAYRDLVRSYFSRE